MRLRAVDRRLGLQGTMRFLFIDALRGFAALAVLVFHLVNNSPQAGAIHAALPAWVLWLPDHGRNGVATFFVISGFVIAYSTRNLGTRVSDAGRFAMRRQIRLDPPYYIVILGVLVLGYLQRAVGLEAPTYTPQDVVLSMLYLADIAGAEQVLDVAWTLCFEVQFYLVVMLLLLGSGLLRRDRATTKSGPSSFVRHGSWVVGVLSLAAPFTDIDYGGWFVPLWWMFYLGMVVCWFQLGVVSRRWVWTVLVLVGGWCVALQAQGLADPYGGEWTAWGTAVVTLLVLQAPGSMTRMSPAIMYFGALSYSLYLVHLPVLEAVMGAIYKVGGDDPVWVAAALVLGAAASIGVAHVLLVIVERPSIRWSASLKRSPSAVASSA